MNDIPKGLCQCGCGQPTPLAIKTNSGRGDVKGQPVRYIKDHYWNAPERQLLARFWKCVDKNGPNGCWLWTGNFSGGDKTLRYGVIRAQKATGNRYPLRVHRLSYELVHGKIPDGLFALHRCDNSLCVNPEHIFLGTIAENNRDRDLKGRTSHANGRPMQGELNPSKKLSRVQVNEIRRLYDSGEYGVMALSIMFQMSRDQIGRIVHRKSWVTTAPQPR